MRAATVSRNLSLMGQSSMFVTFAARCVLCATTTRCACASDCEQRTVCGYATTVASYDGVTSRSKHGRACCSSNTSSFSQLPAAPTHSAHQYPPVHGLVAPTYSPLFANGSVDLSGVDRQAEFLRATNVTTVFPCGTTGESVDLTVTERKLRSQSAGSSWAAFA